jgi:hypothetical protein
MTLICEEAFDELDAYEFRLFAHYVRHCGESPDEQYKKSVDITAKLIGIGEIKVRTARASLAQKGYIHLQERPSRPAIVTIA